MQVPFAVGERMKIFHIITGLATGGAERALYNVLAGGLAKEFDCAVLSLGDEGTMGPLIHALGVPVSSLGMRAGLPGAAALLQLRHQVRAFRPDVVQGWMYHGNLAASLAAWLASGTPAVAWNVRHSLYELRAEKTLTRQVIRANRLLSGHADAVIYNSHLSCRQHESFGLASASATVIPNGFDLERLAPDAEAGAAVRAELGLAPDALVVGHVARFHPMKDHASFLRAAVRVAQASPAARFLLVGRQVSPDNQALAGIIPADLMERFVFTGERPDANRLMRAMDVMATSSAWGEAFPNVLGEAMACGVPCVATDVGDSREIVSDTGMVVPPRDSEALADALLSMLGKAPTERTALGHAARLSVERRYALVQVVDRYAQTYRDIAK